MVLVAITNVSKKKEHLKAHTHKYTHIQSHETPNTKYFGLNKYSFIFKNIS